MTLEFEMTTNLVVDTDGNAAYLRLGGTKVARQTILDRMGLVVDWDGQDAIVGIEFLFARTQLGAVWGKALTEGERRDAGTEE